MFDRLLKLITEKDLEKIKNTKILLVGVGGVGGFVLEALVRSGFTNITLYDGDKIEESNLNRQIITNRNNLHKSKAQEAKLRALSINPDIVIKAEDVYLTLDNFEENIKEEYDYIIDACDDIKIKIALIKYAKKFNIKIITCLGTARKLDINGIKVTKLNKTFNDPLAKKLRELLRKENIALNIPVVFSEAQAIKTDDILGSAIFVPAIAGITLANYVFLDVINRDNE